MKTEIKDKWVAALKSGKYIQGHCRLQTIYDDGTRKHCCLGVLCELAIEDGVQLETRVVPRSGFQAVIYSGSLGVLPDQVRRWAGLFDKNGYYVEEVGKGTTLIRENDNGSTFEQIAELIEKHCEQL